MDAQRKKGILDVCVLAVLKKGPSYGYKIIRDISRCIDISESTLYPILKRLEQNGSLQTYREEYNGRIRKYYELTETGQNRINVFLDEWEELRTMYLFIEEENRQVAETPFRGEAAGEQKSTAEPEAKSNWRSEMGTPKNVKIVSAADTLNETGPAAEKFTGNGDRTKFAAVSRTKPEMTDDGVESNPETEEMAGNEAMPEAPDSEAESKPGTAKTEDAGEKTEREAEAAEADRNIACEEEQG